MIIAQKLLALSIVTLCLLAICQAQAKARPKKNSESLSTNVEFDAMTVHGRYQYAAEATAKVENEKVLFDLLGPRKDFKDRLNKQGKQR